MSCMFDFFLRRSWNCLIVDVSLPLSPCSFRAGGASSCGLCYDQVYDSWRLFASHGRDVSAVQNQFHVVTSSHILYLTSTLPFDCLRSHSELNCLKGRNWFWLTSRTRWMRRPTAWWWTTHGRVLSSPLEAPILSRYASLLEL